MAPVSRKACAVACRVVSWVHRVANDPKGGVIDFAYVALAHLP